MYEFNEMVNIVMMWFHKGKVVDQQTFIETHKENLVKYHTSLGRSIRNEFKLWDNEWKPDIREGVDCSPDHPDQISMRVIEEVWRRLKDS
jgi:hypothetical protein